MRNKSRLHARALSVVFLFFVFLFFSVKRNVDFCFGQGLTGFEGSVIRRYELLRALKGPQSGGSSYIGRANIL